MEQYEFEFRTLETCTFQQAVDLWNSGFQQYYSNMTTNVESMTSYLGTYGIWPQLSVTAFVAGEPAGFVYIAVKTDHGERIAWNGGTGVNPKFRGKGLAKKLMQEAARRIAEAGIRVSLLEVVSHNDKAIAAYASAGFEAIDDLIGMKREEPFSELPFQCQDSAGYSVRRGLPTDAVGLPFFLKRSAWSSQWFNLSGGEAVLVADRTGKTVGYALCRKSFDDYGRLQSIVLHQCEVAPDREDAETIVRVALAQAFSPLDASVKRLTDNLRSSSQISIDALKEAGFSTVYEQKLMQWTL